ncbi:hypothetical protein BJ508DRAFT_309634 [Ascobolus immersus RN42]|uniref:Uncharacterized protein n=1 Tax=Ascobolus immersus RN42 TaxID=1160509 RepID=A0A3N4I1N8_ASCIM|nr:hypothetical protein BJ508DRAFT_309634 [Ascobolus immersus RN42]
MHLIRMNFARNIVVAVASRTGKDLVTITARTLSGVYTSKHYTPLMLRFPTASIGAHQMEPRVSKIINDLGYPNTTTLHFDRKSSTLSSLEIRASTHGVTVNVVVDEAQPSNMNGIFLRHRAGRDLVLVQVQSTLKFDLGPLSTSRKSGSCQLNCEMIFEALIFRARVRFPIRNYQSERKHGHNICVCTCTALKLDFRKLLGPGFMKPAHTGSTQ